MDPEIAAQHVGRIDAIMKPGNITEIWKDGVKVKIVPTDPSQIRHDREPLTWKPGRETHIDKRVAVYSGIDHKKLIAWGVVADIDSTRVTVITDKQEVISVLRGQCSLEPAVRPNNW